MTCAKKKLLKKENMFFGAYDLFLHNKIIDSHITILIAKFLLEI